MHKTLTALASFVALALSGCATLMNDTTQAVNIKTDPPGAICEVKALVLQDVCREPKTWTGVCRGREIAEEVEADISIASIVTPGIVVLSRDHSYSVSCQLSGYKNSRGTIRKHFSSWFYFTVGNLFFDGLIPGLIADSITGAANQLSSPKMEPDMENMQGLPGKVAPAPSPSIASLHHLFAEMKRGQHLRLTMPSAQPTEYIFYRFRVWDNAIIVNPVDGGWLSRKLLYLNYILSAEIIEPQSKVPSVSTTTAMENTQGMPGYVAPPATPPVTK